MAGPRGNTSMLARVIAILSCWVLLAGVASAASKKAKPAAKAEKAAPVAAQTPEQPKISAKMQKLFDSLTGLDAENNTWLATHQRLCYAVFSDNLDMAVKDGTNVVCGGTNASGMGFAGGPYVLGKNNELVEVRTGNPLSDADIKQLRANVDRAHAKGMKVIGEVIRMHMTPWVQAEHPDWQVLNSPGEKPLPAEKIPESMVLGCWNSPYGDYFIKSHVELARRLDWDGYNLDGFGCWMQCYCPHCVADYKNETGKDMPGGINANDPEWRRYLKWKLDRYTKFVAKWTMALKSMKPGFVCLPWTTGPGRWWHWMGAPAVEGSDNMHRVLDAAALELLWDFPPDQGSNLLPSFTCRYYRGLTGDSPAWVLPYLCEQGQFGMQSPAAECMLRYMTVVTNGCLAAGLMGQESVAMTNAQFNKMLEEREPFTKQAKSFKWAAMLVGESSRLLYGLPGARMEVPLGHWFGSGVDTQDIGRLAAGERRMPAHMESSVGVFRAAMQDHLPLDIIIEPDVENLNALKQYKVLILANAACLSKKANDNIRQFVKDGGGIVAMHEASVCNEFGDRQTDFGLSDVFGVHFKGTDDYSARWPTYERWVQCYLPLAGIDSHEIVDDPVIRSNYRGGDRVNYIGWMTNVDVITGARKLGRRLADPEWPFIVINEPGSTSSVGAGRSIYFACDMGQAYFIAPFHYQRKLLSNAIKWAAGPGKCPFAIEAPMCVQTAFYTQNNGKRKIVHLLNEVNTNADGALPENSPSMREDVLPIQNIRVKINDETVSTAFQEPGHIVLPITKGDGGVQVTVPRLDMHAMVVFE